MYSDCNRPVNPEFGHFECTSPSYSQDSTCRLVCDEGLVPSGKSSMQCQLTGNGFDWNAKPDEFRCVQPCHLVVGGMNGTRSVFEGFKLNKLLSVLSIDEFGKTS